MGNRASISIENCSTGIYLHWNGGCGSVLAFVEEANKRYCASRHGQSTELSITDDRYVFELYAAIREFFNFSGDIKHRCRDSLSLRLGDYENDEDNGHYHIKQNGEFDHSKTSLIEDAEYTKSSYQFITNFYLVSEQLMLKADWTIGSKEQEGEVLKNV